MGQSYRDLIAWQKAMTLVTDVYRATRRFPGEERCGLTTQLRESAVLVPSKIAEGQARFSAGEFYHFLSMVRDSLMEAETHVQVAMNLDYLSDIDGIELLEKTAELGRVLNGLLASIETTA